MKGKDRNVLAFFFFCPGGEKKRASGGVALHFDVGASDLVVWMRWKDCTLGRRKQDMFFLCCNNLFLLR